MLPAQRVLVLIEMDKYIADLSTLVTHGIVGGAVEIADFEVALEQADKRQGELGLSGAFLAVDIQEGEGTGGVHNDVPEQGGKIETDGNDAIVTIQLTDQCKELHRRNLTLGGMEEPPLIGKSGFVAFVDLGEGGQIEILIVQTDDAILIDWLPLTLDRKSVV